jgi:hypothetical protein
VAWVIWPKALNLKSFKAQFSTNQTLKDKIEKKNWSYKRIKLSPPKSTTKPIGQVMRSGNLIKIKMKRIMKPSLFRKTSLAYKTCEPFDQKHQIYIKKNHKT